MPLQRRVPKRGFVNIFGKEFSIVNVSALDQSFEDGAVVDIDALIEKGLVKKVLDGVKILGNGEISKKLTVQVNAYSEAAKQKDRGGRRKGRGDLTCFKPLSTRGRLPI